MHSGRREQAVDDGFRNRYINRQDPVTKPDTQIDCEPRLRRLNLRKHGVSFADAVIAREDDGALTLRDPFSEEERWVTMGLDGFGRAGCCIHLARRNVTSDPGAEVDAA
jgi:uncharacterized DUF497 family protein